MKVLIVGCGSIGSRHARNLSGMAGIDLVVTDVDEAARVSVGREAGAAVVGAFEDGLELRPDVVFVCLPNHLHVKAAHKALETGAHVFVEKPLSHTVDGVDPLIAEAASRKRILFVACNLRFHRPISTMKSWVDQGRIGKPLFGRFRFGNYLPNWRPERDYRQSYSAREDWGGGIVLDAVHEIDSAMQFMGDPVAVTAWTGKLSGLDIDTEDTAEIILRFSSGSVANIHLDYLRPVRARSYELLGESGMITWEARNKSPEEGLVEFYDSSGTRQDQISFNEDLNHQYFAETTHFLNCVRGMESPVSDGNSAKRVLEVALAALQASRSSTTVKV